MQTARGQISTTVVALLLVVVVLGSSTLYLASLAYQPRPTSPTTIPATNGVKLPQFNAAADADQTATATSSADSITVSGTGQASYTPNEALIQVSVQTDNATAEGATSSNAQVMVNVIKALNGIGISNSSIQTQGYSLSVNYANCYSSCVPQITGYTVTNSLQVNITSGTPAELGLMAGKVIDTSVSAGANGIGLSFGATNTVLNQLTNEALQNAVASADSQASTIASSLGVSISGVISATESGSYSPYNNIQSLSVASAATYTPIVPGTQTVSATVQVVYSIS